MAIPTQATSGSEVLRRGSIDALSNTETAFKFDGTAGGTGSGHQAYTVPALHIITMISIIISERGNASKYVHMWLENVTTPNTSLISGVLINSWSSLLVGPPILNVFILNIRLYIKYPNRKNIKYNNTLFIIIYLIKK